MSQGGILNSQTIHVEEPTTFIKEPFSGPIAKLDELTNGVRTLEKWYAADFERRVGEITELLRNQITAELRSHYSSELCSQIDRLRTQYEERLYGQSKEFQSKYQVLQTESERLQRQLKKVSEEIATTEAMLDKSDSNRSSDIERLPFDAASLAKLVEIRVRELEKKAYLKGLRFHVATEDQRLVYEPLPSDHSSNRTPASLNFFRSL